MSLREGARTFRVAVATCVVVLSVSVAGTWWFFLKPVVITDACPAFVTNYSKGSVISPRLLEHDGALVLAVPFTPDGHERQSTAIIRALRVAQRRIRIEKTSRELEGIGLTDGEMLVRVGSAREARDVLLELCFRPQDPVFPSL